MGPQELTPEQKLKGALIFKYLKTGKIPKRKGLFRTLFFLAGEQKNFKGITMTSSSVTLKRPTIDRTIQIKIHSNANIENIENIFNTYLSNYEFKIEPFNAHINFITVYYCSKDINWGMIDEELRTNYKQNIQEIDGLPKIINYETK
jgi:hypothetical protein